MTKYEINFYVQPQNTKSNDAEIVTAAWYGCVRLFILLNKIGNWRKYRNKFGYLLGLSFGAAITVRLILSPIRQGKGPSNLEGVWSFQMCGHSGDYIITYLTDLYKTSACQFRAQICAVHDSVADLGHCAYNICTTTNIDIHKLPVTSTLHYPNINRVFLSIELTRNWVIFLQTKKAKSWNNMSQLQSTKYWIILG